MLQQMELRMTIAIQVNRWQITIEYIILQTMQITLEQVIVMLMVVQIYVWKVFPIYRVMQMRTMDIMTSKVRTVATKLVAMIFKIYHIPATFDDKAQHEFRISVKATLIKAMVMMILIQIWIMCL